MKRVNWCPRVRSKRYCSPYSNVMSTCGTTFICCGNSALHTRTVSRDRFRLCFVSETTDSMDDLDEGDMKDQMGVMASAFALGCYFE